MALIPKPPDDNQIDLREIISNVVNVPLQMAAQPVQEFGTYWRDLRPGTLMDGLKAADNILTGGMIEQAYLLGTADTDAQRKEALKRLAIAGALNLAGFGVGRAIGAGTRVAANAAARRAGQELVEVGAHHSVIPGITDTILPSIAETGRVGITAADQVPGYSYFWNTENPQRAIEIAQGQLNMLDDKWMGMVPEGYGPSIYITKVPKYMVEPDPNIPGSAARRIFGGQTIVDRVTRPWEYIPGAGSSATGPVLTIAAPDATQEALAKLMAAQAQASARNARIEPIIRAGTAVGRTSPALLDIPIGMTAREAALSQLAQQRANRNTNRSVR